MKHSDAKMKALSTSVVDLLLLADDVIDEYQKRKEKRTGEKAWDEPPTFAEKIVLAQVLAGAGLAAALDRTGAPSEPPKADLRPGTTGRVLPIPGAPGLVVGATGSTPTAPDPEWSKRVMAAWEKIVQKECGTGDWEYLKRLLRETDEGRWVLSLLSYENWALREASNKGGAKP